MTDKVQKIREVVVRLQKRAEHFFDISLTENERQFWLGESNVLTLIEKHIDSLQEEPVSEDFEQALAKEWQNYIDRGAATVDALEDNTQELAFAKGFYRGAKWQKEQFEKNRLKHCNSITNEQAELEQGFIDQHIDKYNRMPTFLDAIEYGMRLQKEKMTEEAIDVEVKVDAGGYPYIDKTIELYDYDKDVPLAKAGDKYKVILIKED